MDLFLRNPMLQYGALGLAFLLTVAFIRAFFLMMAQRQSIQESLMAQHNARERAFTDQFLACIERNSAALEKVEQGLHRIQIQIAQSEGGASEVYLSSCVE